MEGDDDIDPPQVRLTKEELPVVGSFCIGKCFTELGLSRVSPCQAPTMRIKIQLQTDGPREV